MEGSKTEEGASKGESTSEQEDAPLREEEIPDTGETKNGDNATGGKEASGEQNKEDTESDDEAKKTEPSPAEESSNKDCAAANATGEKAKKEDTKDDIEAADDDAKKMESSPTEESNNKGNADANGNSDIPKEEETKEGPEDDIKEDKASDKADTDNNTSVPIGEESASNEGSELASKEGSAAKEESSKEDSTTREESTSKEDSTTREESTSKEDQSDAASKDELSSHETGATTKVKVPDSSEGTPSGGATASEFSEMVEVKKEADNTSKERVGDVAPDTTANMDADVKIVVQQEPGATDKAEEEEEEEEEEVFEYDYEVMKSTSTVVGTSVSNMLQLYHSFGYECHKRFNLVVLAKDVVAYAAGNMVIILNLATQQQTCYRSLGGGGIGAIAAHPSQTYLAVGEKGKDPVIAIYTYPEFILHRVLRGGTEAMYSHLDFSPGEGNLLASVGGDPDFMLTVWDWIREKIVLRYKAFSQEIYRVSFSPENAEQLTTSGTGHIRFWKMASTFTGLKLQGQLGKFGRIEISDISAYVELPDGKVLSGTEWGNFLLWDGGFIKVELSKKGKKFCHNGMIEAIYLDEGELISAGVDGYIRVWNFETIDSADISDESATFEIEPLTEIRVGNSVCFKSLVHSVDPETPNLWYGQDASGAIWKIDVVVSHTRRPPEKLMNFHGGQIMGVVCSPVTHQAASISQNGSIRVYDLPEKKLLCHSEFVSGGSSLMWAPVEVDQQAITLIAGFNDGVLRVLRLEEKEGRSSTQHRGHSGKCWLNLVHASKPHKLALTSLAVDPEGKILATGGKDSTVFFMSIEEDYSPIGFIRTPSAVRTLQWSSPHEEAGLLLLVCCEDGSMMEVEAPVKGQYDTAKTYYLDPLKFTTRKFDSIKDKLRAAEEEARKAAERERKQKEKEAKRKKRMELMGDDYVSEEEEEEEEEVEAEEGEGQKEQEKEKGPSSILEAFYSKENPKQFWISMDGYDAGYLYRCSMEGAKREAEPYQPPHAVPVPSIDAQDIPLQSLSFSASGEYLLTGTTNGCVRVHPLSAPHSLADLSSYWALNMHDNHYGNITSLTSTFDDRYVLSGGADGNVFVYEANLPTAAERAEAMTVTIPQQSEGKATDIDDPEHYSIEDAKQKAEHDRKMKQAEEKKLLVRRQIASLRRTFAKLHSRNAQLPSHLQLPPEAFVMDPDMEERLKEQTEEKVELVHKEMSWEAEKHRIALEKLHNKYRSIVDCERFEVWAFQGEHKASSYRSPRPSPQFLEAIRQNAEYNADEFAWSTTAEKARKRSGERKSLKQLPVSHSQDFTDTSTKIESTREKLTKEDVRKLRKFQRDTEMLEHEKKRPDENSDDPEDARAYRQARDNMGDYKLKTATDYVVPKGQQVTTEIKRWELLMLRKKILENKTEYNEQLLALRDKKLQIIEKIKTLVERITNLQSDMNPTSRKPLPPIPTMRPEEMPEKQREYTKESLLRFKEEKAALDEAERLAAAGLGEGGFFGGFGGDEGGEGQEKENDKEDEKVTSKDTRKVDTDQTMAEEGLQPDRRKMTDISTQEQLMAAMTPIQRYKYQEHQIRCVYERDALLAEIEKLQSDFDEVLMRLYHKKAQLDITMVTADTKHITYFEEMILLKEFEKRETTFTSRYTTKQNEKLAMAERIEITQHEIHEKEKHLNRLQEQEKALVQTFIEAIGDNNKFKEFLLKVFRKKIKRMKRKSEAGEEHPDGQEDEDEDEENDEDTDSDDLSSSDEDSEGEGELDDTVCPAGCDQALFGQACELRERRLDLEEMVTDEKKALDAQRKELEGMKKKAKSMESQVKSALSDLQAFQLKKQQRLNEFHQVAVLSLHQILHYMPDGEPPLSTAPCLVFPAAALQRLGHRIGELSMEKLQEKKRYKELRQQFKRLGREKKEMLAELSALSEKVNEAMLLKFGQTVDLEKLEVLSSNPVIDEKRKQIRVMEHQASKELAALDHKIDEKKRELVNLVQENTIRLNRMHDLVVTMKAMEERLDNRQKSMSKEVAGVDRYMTDEEHQKLLEIVRLQLLDIQNVREEIQLLQHKGGHILPPAQPPAPLQPN